MRTSTERTLAESVAVTGALTRRPMDKPGRTENPSLATPDEFFERGLCHSTGQGVPQDLVKAHTFFNLAALAGNARAREMRTEVAQDMTPAEIATAQRRAREIWGRRH